MIELPITRFLEIHGLAELEWFLFEFLWIERIVEIQMVSAETQSWQIVHGNSCKISWSELDEDFLFFGNNAFDISKVTE